MSQKKLQYGVVALVIAVAIGGLFLRWSQQRNYKPRIEDLGTVRYNPQTKVMIYRTKGGKTSSEFPDLTKFSKDIVKGMGVRLTLVRDPNLPDAGPGQREFLVEPNQYYRQKSEASRRVVLRDKKLPELGQLKEWLTGEGNRSLWVDVGFDVTEGVPLEEVGKVKSVIKQQKYAEFLRARNHITFHFWVIGDTEFLANRIQEFGPENADTLDASLEALCDEILFPREYDHKYDYSAIAESIAKFAAEKPDYPDRVMFIFCDGVHSTDKFSFYKKSTLLNPIKKDDVVTYPGYQVVDKALWGAGDKESLPPVQHAVVHWYRPTTSDLSPDLVRKSSDYWKDLLKRAGAQVTMH